MKFLISNFETVKRFPEAVLELASRNAITKEYVRSKPKTGPWAFDLSASSFSNIMKYSDDRALR